MTLGTRERFPRLPVSDEELVLPKEEHRFWITTRASAVVLALLAGLVVGGMLSSSCASLAVGPGRETVVITPRFERIVSSKTSWIGIPDFSPDGRWVVYATEPVAQVSNLLIVPAAGGAPKALTTGNFVDYGPIWFPSSDRVSFVSNRVTGGGAGRNQLHLMSIDIDAATGGPKTDPVPIVAEPVSGFGAPSPDGTRIAYATHALDGRVSIREAAVA